MTSVPPAPAVATARPGFFAWWHDGTPDAKRALVAAGLGWMLDAFDVMLYALLLTSIIADLGITRQTAVPLARSRSSRPPQAVSSSASSPIATAARAR